jgi:hypothetical protein
MPGRHWIMPSPTPGVAAAQAADPEPGSTEDAVRLQRREEISRASRLKPAARPRAAQKSENRRNENLVTSNKKTREKEHQGARIEARSARRNHSSFSS